MENAILIIFVLLVIFMLLQTPMFYRSQQTDLDDARPVTWNYDWGGGHGFSRSQINNEVS